MNTEDVAVLVAAVAAGSLAAAARRLGITPMVATRRLAALERELGVRLMQRTTRSLSLTPEGESFLPFAQSLVENDEAGRAVLRSSTLGASGLLRVTTSLAFGRKVLAPMIPRLLAAHPHLRVDLEMTDHQVDIVASGTDLAIRIARLRDSSLIARRIAPSARILCAAPSYIAARGRPSRLEELLGHDCLAQTGTTHWTFRQDGREQRARVMGRFTSNAIEGLHAACLGGAGIALLSEWNVREDMRDGRLIEITLADAVPDDLSIWAVYPTTKQVLPKLRIFVAALEAELATASAK
ncbi:DNA-binding transcriptional LysR family regulator [Rhizomicrobium palustre]|uniref:DNA-binding transcriptional LysR family regulator n=1 Tax=Rhizomicrobium palustre TaxID=189966 RepID=A0A846MUZ3_9PROT|nr:LysR family transcriptional regulator [Rhizomicrobium palustre]NIK87049.1 DNA-binding transcriptional LysR family regulator [Rhizomicrobium palustre]